MQSSQTAKGILKLQCLTLFAACATFFAALKSERLSRQEKHAMMITIQAISNISGYGGGAVDPGVRLHPDS